MELQRVQSTNLHSVGYDPATRELRIRFLKAGEQPGRTYSYENVDPALHKGLLAATRKGKYFHRHIADKHKYRPLDES